MNCFVYFSFSWETIDYLEPVEVPIRGLLVEPGLVEYDVPNTAEVPVSLSAGTRVNFTCTVDHVTECSNFTLADDGGECYTLTGQQLINKTL